MKMAILFEASILVLCSVADEQRSRRDHTVRRVAKGRVSGLLLVGHWLVRWVGSLAIKKLVVSRWRGFAMEVFASRPCWPSRRDRCSDLDFCLCSSLHVATTVSVAS
ncbi:hypothetical protein L2E82_30874 [Cichorium intybus]|uniref:Uncharacterized protein n=1 Tax=Cichorium intybus TaxID=13427 RepID=A0ACB9D1P2_CICIN|nr:hypothetical protein L2E82_30874 [Cichorium intybus]